MWPGCGWAAGAMIDKAHLQIVSKTDIFISGRSCCSASSDEWRPWLLCCGSRSWWEESACHVWACRFDLYIHVSKIWSYIYIYYIKLYLSAVLAELPSWIQSVGRSSQQGIAGGVEVMFGNLEKSYSWNEIPPSTMKVLARWLNSETWRNTLAATFAVGEASQSVSKLKGALKLVLFEDFIYLPPRSTVPIGANIIDGMKAGCIGDCLRRPDGIGHPLAESDHSESITPHVGVSHPPQPHWVTALRRASWAIKVTWFL